MRRIFEVLINCTKTSRYNTRQVITDGQTLTSMCTYACTACRAINDRGGRKIRIPKRKLYLETEQWCDVTGDCNHQCEPRKIDQVSDFCPTTKIKDANISHAIRCEDCRAFF